MFGSKFVNRALLGFTALGVAAAAAGGLLGVGLGGQTPAGAAPREVPAGTLGVGTRTIAPLGTPVDADDKIEVEGGAHFALGALAGGGGVQLAGLVERLRVFDQTPDQIGG